MLHFIARKRPAAGKLTVVDATNVQPESRKPLVEPLRHVPEAVFGVLALESEPVDPRL